MANEFVSFFAAQVAFDDLNAVTHWLVKVNDGDVVFTAADLDRKRYPCALAGFPHNASLCTHLQFCLGHDVPLRTLK
ncbi:hypothetical protein D3C85_1724680 [compost metagenome]